MFRARSPREALLEIRRLAATIETPVSYAAIDEVALDGLSARGMENFELSDQLADRLAEAHGILRDLRRDGDTASIPVGRLEEALALPPDIEAMIDRRIR